MGSRLYYAIKYNPEFDGGFFNRDQTAWDRLFSDKFGDNWHEENAYEVNRKELDEYIKSIADEPGNNEYFTDYTNEQVVEKLSEILLSEDDLIRIEWY